MTQTLLLGSTTAGFMPRKQLLTRQNSGKEGGSGAMAGKLKAHLGLANAQPQALGPVCRNGPKISEVVFWPRMETIGIQALGCRGLR